MFLVPNNFFKIMYIIICSKYISKVIRIVRIVLSSRLLRQYYGSFQYFSQDLGNSLAGRPDFLDTGQ